MSSLKTDVVKQTLSLVYGPKTPPLWEKTMGTLIREQAKKYGNHTAVSVPWQSTRLTYQDLADRSKVVAKAILSMGLRRGQCLGIMAGNCYQYIEVFLGSARIGCPVVVLNNTYSPEELEQAVSRSSCRLLFIASSIGPRALSGHIQTLLKTPRKKEGLRHLICLGDSVPQSKDIECHSYSAFVSNGHSVFMNDAVLAQSERKVVPSDVLNLQFTSGTTGLPKAAMLTHRNLINDARFIGGAMKLTKEDIVCCPPPLFHCFGLVIGFLAAFCCGSAIIFPSDNFNAKLAVEAIVREKATALLGVPTMFIAELEVLKKEQYNITTLRTGIAAGTSVPQSLMDSIQKNMHMDSMLIAYGMTETSPVTFMTAIDDPKERRYASIGRVLPHTGAKVIDKDGNIVPFGTRGELCTNGFALQKGYLDDDVKTRQAMKTDTEGIVWMHTGDEAFIDEEGYGYITGRIKDLIIRGGENISPAEIEDRLIMHPSITEACVVGVDDKKYGEVVGCFLRQGKDTARPTDDEVQSWVTQTLSWIKIPQYIFWIGDTGVLKELPKTGSGKYQKYLIRQAGNALVKRRRPEPKL
ncbi:4-coumarate-CoA ligase [Xylogone sp. PMI_703]|nr:4-coumarate-CoA ligase [Xylogone sp. PMI_703]